MKLEYDKRLFSFAFKFTLRPYSKGIGVYLPHLRMLSEKYGTKRVYLATDDAAVIKSVNSPVIAAEFEFIYIQQMDARALMAWLSHSADHACTSSFSTLATFDLFS